MLVQLVSWRVNSYWVKELNVCRMMYVVNLSMLEPKSFQSPAISHCWSTLIHPRPSYHIFWRSIFVHISINTYISHVALPIPVFPNQDSTLNWLWLFYLLQQSQAKRTTKDYNIYQIYLTSIILQDHMLVSKTH